MSDNDARQSYERKILLDEETEESPDERFLRDPVPWVKDKRLPTAEEFTNRWNRHAEMGCYCDKLMHLYPDLPKPLCLPHKIRHASSWYFTQIHLHPAPKACLDEETYEFCLGTPRQLASLCTYDICHCVDDDNCTTLIAIANLLHPCPTVTHQENQRAKRQKRSRDAARARSGASTSGWVPSNNE